MSWAEWVAEAPTVRALWDKTHKARQSHPCGFCGDAIEQGETYESRGWIEDGEFKAEKTHRHAYQYPSGCPRQNAKDRAEIDAQFAEDADTLRRANPLEPDFRRLG